jgi:cell shape-determining protein MreC
LFTRIVDLFVDLFKSIVSGVSKFFKKLPKIRNKKKLLAKREAEEAKKRQEAESSVEQ